MMVRLGVVLFVVIQDCVVPTLFVVTSLVMCGTVHSHISYHCCHWYYFADDQTQSHRLYSVTFLPTYYKIIPAIIYHHVCVSCALILCHHGVSRYNKKNLDAKNHVFWTEHQMPCDWHSLLGACSLPVFVPCHEIASTGSVQCPPE
jgi:hypothetical protein